MPQVAGRAPTSSIHFSSDSWGDTWGDSLKDVQTSAGCATCGEADCNEIAGQHLVAALKSIRFGQGAHPRDDGLGLRSPASSPEKVPEATPRFPASMASGTDPADLKGLPDGPVVFAEGPGATGKRTTSA